MQVCADPFRRHTLDGSQAAANLSAARNGACRAPEPQETVPEYTLPWQCRPASIAALHVSRREFAESAHAGGIVDDAQNRE